MSRNIGEARITRHHNIDRKKLLRAGDALGHFHRPVAGGSTTPRHGGWSSSRSLPERPRRRPAMRRFFAIAAFFTGKQIPLSLKML
jgi:hypothetical protein